MTFNDIYGDSPMRVKERRIRRNGFVVRYWYDIDNPKDKYVIDDFDAETLISTDGRTLHRFVDDTVVDFVNDKQKRIPYGFDYQHENVLKDIAHNVAYHVAESKNVKNIEKLGLIPGMMAGTEVSYASLYMDARKPKRIPYWMNRTLSVYARPHYHNAQLSMRYDDYGNFSLFAIDMEGIRYGVGSEGVGGFCLCWAETAEEYDRWIHSKDLKTNVETYWKIFLMDDEYVAGGAKRKRWENYYGLDEMLIPQRIPCDRITFLGDWNTGRFVPSSSFRCFVKDQYKDNWRDILSMY